MIVRALTALPPLPVNVWLRRPAPHLPFPLEDPQTGRFPLGRTALWHGIRAIGIRAGEEVLVPAYHHGSEIQAIVSAGVVPRFYSTRPGLMPDIDELETLVTARTRALLIIHVLGLLQPAGTYRRWCDDRRLLLIEDIAQGWLAENGGQPAGWDADLALFCLYKTFGIPDGAAVRVRGRTLTALRPRRVALTSVAKGHAAWVAQRSPLVGAGWAWARRRRTTKFDPNRDIALGDTSQAMSSTAEKLLSRLVATPAAALRRLHYRLLLDNMAELVPHEMPALADGASPFVFPIFAPDKAAQLERLARAGVHALDYWSIPHPSLEAPRDPIAARLRRHVVGLPVHQELSEADLGRITDAVVRRGPRLHL